MNNEEKSTTTTFSTKPSLETFIDRYEIPITIEAGEAKGDRMVVEVRRLRQFMELEMKQLLVDIKARAIPVTIKKATDNISDVDKLPTIALVNVDIVEESVKRIITLGE